MSIESVLYFQGDDNVVFNDEKWRHMEDTLIESHQMESYKVIHS